jgi:hypothetical protein
MYCSTFSGLAAIKLFVERANLCRNYLFKMMKFKEITGEGISF